MKALLSLISVFLVVLLAGTMMLTNPTVEDFGTLIVATETGTTDIPDFREKVEKVKTGTTVKDYHIYSIFTYEGERYLGMLSEIVSEDEVKKEMDESNS